MATIAANKSETIRAVGTFILKAELFCDTQNDSIKNNTSLITATATLSKGTGSFSSSSKQGTLAIYWHDNRNNTDVFWKSLDVSKLMEGSVSVSDTREVIHNDDGTLSGYAIAKWTKTGTLSYTPSSGEISTDTKEFNTIPRASYFSITNCEIEGVSTINISRASDNFTHTLTYVFGNLSGTIMSNVGTSCSWNIPASFYEQIPNAKSGICTITCITYNEERELGRVSSTVTINCNESKCKPSLTAILVDGNPTTIALTGDASKLIKSKSIAKVTPTASAKNSSTISKISVDGVDINGSITISNVTKNSFVIVATDSRGFSTSLTLTAIMIDYIPLTCNAAFKRKGQTSGEVVLNYSGNYFNNTFGAVANNLTMYWSYRQKGSSEWIKGGNLAPTINGNTYKGSISCGTQFDYKKAYEFTVFFADKLVNSNSGINPIYKGEPNFVIFKDCIMQNGNLFQTIIENVILECDKKKYPIGIIELNTSGKNPSEYLGFGTWVAWGSGRVLVGVDITQTEFNVVEKTGGSKYLQSHSHDVKAQQDYFFTLSKEGASDWYGSYQATGAKWAPTFQSDGMDWSWGKATAQSTGEGDSGNLQPYITCYMWKRIK